MRAHSLILPGFLLIGILLLSSCSFAPPTPPPFTPPARTATATVTVTPTITPNPPTATPKPVCKDTEGTIEGDRIDTVLLDKAMTYKVYLPPCYNFDKQTRYPVLYLLHGQNSTEEQWIRIGAESSADKIISTENVQPFIIVFPYDYSYKQPGEYNFEQVFVDLLIPKIDQTYRTMSERGKRAIGGLSRGGAWALRIGTRHPDLFGAIGGHSPAIFYTDEKPLIRRILALPPEKLPHIWLDAGTNDSERNVIVPFEQFLTDNNIAHVWHEYDGWHDEKYWSAHITEYLRWYAENWK